MIFTNGSNNTANTVKKKYNGVSKAKINWNITHQALNRNATAI